MNIGPILRAMKHNRTRVILIVLEIAMTLAIVTNCVNVIMAERVRMSQKSGFDDENILAIRTRPFATEFQEESFVDAIIDNDLRAIESIPEVRAVANTNFQLWEGGGSGTNLRPLESRNEPAHVQIYFSTPGFFDTLGSPIIDGRGFRPEDYATGGEQDPFTVVVITKTMADLMFPEGGAVGKSVQLGSHDDPFLDPPLTVIGVMGEFYNPFGRLGGDPQPVESRAMIIPARVGGYYSGIRYLVRTEPGATSSIIPAIEKRLTAVDSRRVFEFQTMTDKKARWFSGSKIIVTTMTCIIIALVAVTALGLLGLTSLAVAERTKQIGTRRALGATRGDIVRHFLIENWLLTTAGLLLGVAGAYALNYMLVSQVSDVKMQWQLIAAGMVLLWINGLLSTIPPALKASMVSPSIATRSV